MFKETLQVSEPVSDMTEMLSMSDWEFETTMA
jgi:hypothetical protein